MRGIWKQFVAPATRISLISATSTVLALATLSQGAFAERSTPSPFDDVPALTEATADEVTIGLMLWSLKGEQTLVAEVRFANASSELIALDPTLITLDVETADETVANRALSDSAPTIPCSIPPQSIATLSFVFDLEAGDALVSLTVGFTEPQRTGAHVILPFAPGAGASAVGGDGQPGADASGGDASPTASAIASPGVGPSPGSCQE